ncbi:alpha/beta hydrolase [Streptomyces chumphonensis]|uniref:alpha/beta hydrolase n=1 Tax=Streptomyces chumphonensis TaxID=1214925 RepID=UPI003D73FF1C
MTLSTLRAVNPDDFEQAADGYHAVSSAAGAAKDRLTNEIIAKSMPVHGQDDSVTGLVGQAADAARKRLQRLADNYHYTQVECGLVRAVLNGFAADLRAAKKKLDAALDDATASGFTVASDGSVTFPSAGEKVDGKTPEGGTAVSYGDTAANGLADQAAHLDPNPHHARAKDCADRIAEALREAEEADGAWAPKLRALKAQNDLTVSHTDWADVHSDQEAVQQGADRYLDQGDIPEGRTPRENAAWWNDLTDEQRADYTALYPSSIGALDGIPSDVRDEANRAVLAQTRGHYETQLAALPAKPGLYSQPGSSDYFDSRERSQQMTEWHQRMEEWKDKHGEEFDRLTAHIRGMDAIEAQLKSSDREGLPESYLLGFNPTGDGQAVIAAGNPDHADHTAVYVPGTGASLSNIEGDIDRMNNLWRVSAPLAPEQNVATVMWLGYDAPDDPRFDAPFAHYAHEGAPALEMFTEGLKESNNTESGGHHTAVGHSYGSTVLGSTARLHGLHVDDMILVGSPGVEVGHASDLGIPEGHVWNQEAAGDIVPDIGRWSHGGENIEFGGGVRVVPSDIAFDAKQMTTDTEGHSDYWKEDSESIMNQANVIVGAYGDVELE